MLDIYTAKKKKMKPILEDLYIKYYVVFSYFCSLPFFFEVHVYIYIYIIYFMTILNYSNQG